MSWKIVCNKLHWKIIRQFTLGLWKKHLEKSATILDRFYITTRYPNGLPDLTPEEAYLEEDAISCLDYAKKIQGHGRHSLHGKTFSVFLTGDF